MFRKLKENLLLTAEISALLIIGGTLISTVVNVIRFQSYGLSFLDVATTSDVFFSGLGIVGELAGIAIAGISGFLLFLSLDLITSKFFPNLKPISRILFLSIFISVSIVSWLYFTRHIPYPEVLREFSQYVGKSWFEFVSGIALYFLFKLTDRTNTELRLIIIALFSLMAVYIALTGAFNQKRAFFEINGDERAIILGGPKECGTVQSAIWIGSESVLVRCRMNNIAVVSRQSVSILKSRLTRRERERRSWQEPVPQTPEWRRLEIEGQPPRFRAPWLIYIDKSSIRFNDGQASYWTIYRLDGVSAKATPSMSGEPYAYLVNLTVDCDAIDPGPPTILNLLTALTDGGLSTSNEFTIPLSTPSKADKMLLSTAEKSFVCSMGDIDGRISDEVDFPLDRARAFIGPVEQGSASVDGASE